MPKAISYIRFSSGKQGKGSTTERQKALIQQWLSQNPDIKLSNLSQEDLGRSGYKGEHLEYGLGRILDAIKEDKIRPGDFILVEAIDRIGRLEPFDMIKLVQDIVAKGVNIVTLEDQQTYSRDNLNNHQGSLYILIGKIQQAHSYSKMLSSRVSASYESRRRSARAGDKINIITPMWLDTHRRLIPEKSDIILKCIDLYLKGYGTRRIILQLMSEHKELMSVHPSTLKRWFRHRALIGEWENKGNHIQNVFEPLIDHVTFYKLQSQLKERSKQMSPEQTYELSGLVKCECCGSKYYYRTRNYKGDKIIYANCSKFLKWGEQFCTNSKSLPYQVLMAVFELTFDEYLATASYNKAGEAQASQIEALKTKKDEINEKIERLLDVLSDTPDLINVKDRIARHNKEIEEVNLEIYSLENLILNNETSANEPDDQDYSLHEFRLLDTARTEMMNIASDPIHLRETLKKSSYEILANGKQAVVNIGPAGKQEYSVVRRSQKHHCYIVRLRVPARVEPKEDSPEDLIDYLENNVYLAINRLGIMEYDTSLDSLHYKLSTRTSDSPLVFEFGDREEYEYTEEMKEEAKKALLKEANNSHDL